ncbi:MAG: HEAT repeat domain-containing protein [Candidatus Neomarinimicrobiota bacterium]|nr:HEAT repeat domain-containing protein [Candidatus Neomarinimicrobiota bacterium]MEC9474542.1 HEAT repeat domain-containing protein [Candidatus Neomarinimicrobiota bacterium]MED5433830.1 HEAT repeat domain-containing protein [Candidatus Neomarinimicrobiota bacterium]|tara:strand:+ start:1521 stop:2378 length:858 start_codon:yes stop_codon:yes gene_type:complete
MHESQSEEKSILKVVIHSFFVVPLVIAIFAVIIFLVIRIMTTEPNSARDYLEDVKIGGTTKRWQGAFELSKMLSNPKMIPKDDLFTNELIATFEYSSNDRDERIRQYLAIAMGATKDERYVPTLIDAIQSSDIGVVQACAFALGNIGSTEAIEPLTELLDEPDPQVRLHSVIALGKIGGQTVVPYLKKMLTDIEPNVRWDAAIGLAKQKDSTARTILLDLLDRKYLNSFPNIDEKEKVQVILVVISVSHFIQNQELKSKLEFLKNEDSNLKIREAARIALEKYII